MIFADKKNYFLVFSIDIPMPCDTRNDIIIMVKFNEGFIGKNLEFPMPWGAVNIGIALSNGLHKAAILEAIHGNF